MKSEKFASALLWRIKSLKGMMGILCAAFFIFHFSFFISCSNPTPEELASLAAKGYYEHLAAGEYEAFVQGMNGTEEAPQDYVHQLRLSVQQCQQRYQDLHKGIQEVRVSSAKADSTLHCTQVFLILCFADSTQEEICVPMVEQNGQWRMR